VQFCFGVWTLVQIVPANQKTLKQVINKLTNEFMRSENEKDPDEIYNNDMKPASERTLAVNTYSLIYS
jgi:hypothetical protein